MNRESWTRPGGPQAALRSTEGSLRRRAALRALALCCTAVFPLRAVAESCATTPPPAVPAGLVQQGQPWSALQTWMTQNQIAFVGAQTAEVTPCPARTAQQQGCRLMNATVAAEQRANCLTSAMVSNGNYYFVGMVRRNSGWQPGNLGFPAANTSNIVYLLVADSQSLGVYQVNGQVFTAPQNANGWTFRFHPDTSFQQASAQWRPDSSYHKGLVAMRDTHGHGGPSAFLLPDDGDGFQNMNPSYGWMTCAAGCCQFHGTGGGDGNPGPLPPGQIPGQTPKPNPGPPPGRPERE